MQNNTKIILKRMLESLAGIVPLGFIGGIIGYSSEGLGIVSGVLWGIGAGTVLAVVYGLGALIWYWVEKALDEGRLWPYISAGMIVSLAVSSYLALSMGSPTCLEYEYDERGGRCVERANDGYEVASEQRWGRFWVTLPITTTIALLVASSMHKRKVSKTK